MTSHTLIWKSTRAPASLGSNPLLGWQRFELFDGTASHFKKVGSPAPLAGLATSALDGAVAARRDVSIAMTVEDPVTTPAADMLDALMQVRPITLICIECAGANTRWAMAHLTSDAGRVDVETLPEPAVQAAINATAKDKWPLYNAAASFYAAPFLLLRHDVTAEGLGLIEPEKITPDMILGMVADDEHVGRATANLDRATLSTHQELVRARDEAMARIGIAPARRAYLYSGEVDSYLIPRAARLGPAAPILQQLRREFAVLYGDYAERVLDFCLRNYHHAKADDLRREAGITVHAEAA
jgi:hypothetical protein